MANQLASSGKVRVQIDLSPTQMMRFNWIMEVCDLENRKDLFNNALSLLEWAAKESSEGRKIASFDDDSDDRYILSMPALSAAAAHAPQEVVVQTDKKADRSRSKQRMAEMS